MDEKLQLVYAEKCKFAIHLQQLGFTPVKVDNYYIKNISSGGIILDLGNNLEFHYYPYGMIKWFVC
jgi:hypothetical protein